MQTGGLSRALDHRNYIHTYIHFYLLKNFQYPNKTQSWTTTKRLNQQGDREFSPLLLCHPHCSST